MKSDNDSNKRSFLDFFKRRLGGNRSGICHRDLYLEISNFQGIGRRRQQEDSFYVSDYNNVEMIEERGFLAVVADGMGGMMNGAEMSAVVTRAAMEFYEKVLPFHLGDGTEELQSMLSFIDGRAKQLQQESDEDESGSTLLAALIRGNRLHFLAVGDSRIYLLRAGKMYQLNREHNVKSKMIERLAKEEIDLESYQDIIGKSGLTSYIGIEELDLYDVSLRPLLLEKNDILLLASDGVFGTLSEETMKRILQSEAGNAAKNMREAIEQAANPKQDNYTGVIIKCK
ncbi:MAG: serine/threonine-protein phosphatase [Lachnospiraceae bacterium]|nr:serine/threonine-protein phosphatase [Lachnospiraceae bacterium]